MSLAVPASNMSRNENVNITQKQLSFQRIREKLLRVRVAIWRKEEEEEKERAKTVDTNITENIRTNTPQTTQFFFDGHNQLLHNHFHTNIYFPTNSKYIDFFFSSELRWVCAAGTCVYYFFILCRSRIWMRCTWKIEVYAHWWVSRVDWCWIRSEFPGLMTLKIWVTFVIMGTRDKWYYYKCKTLPELFNYFWINWYSKQIKWKLLGTHNSS